MIQGWRVVVVGGGMARRERDEERGSDNVFREEIKNIKKTKTKTKKTATQSQTDGRKNIE